MVPCLILFGCTTPITPVYVDVEPIEAAQPTETARLSPAVLERDSVSETLQTPMPASDQARCTQERDRKMQICRDLADSSAQMGSNNAEVAEFTAACFRKEGVDTLRCE